MSRIPDVPDTSALKGGGDRPMTIVRRVGRERERMLGMTDEERAWRKKWLDAQKLAPEEPVTPKGYYEEMYNPIRRFYSAPMNKVQNMMEPLMHWTRQGGWKITVSRPTMYPDTKDLDVLYRTKGNQFYVNGFDKSPI
ncbi:exosome complex exonuclease rrp42 [Lasius niger]|uniref:Exosome complex exonuclease rrp42 n=1 Tax=Lasius niger TaxID=67767 RepID=A0A0J7NZJ3_LASNI|nr:exosome complex exonuclease rrp42 [Lasius niger]